MTRDNKGKIYLKAVKGDLVKLIHGKKRIFQSYHAEFFCCCAAKVCGKLYVCLSVTIKLHICICYKNIQKNFDSAEWLFSALMLHSRAKYGPNNVLQSQPKKSLTLNHASLLCFLEQLLASVFILPSQLAFGSTSSQIEEFWKHRVQIGLRATCNDT